LNEQNELFFYSNMKSNMSTKKKTIPKVVKTLAWEKWIGEDIAKTKCLCCGVTDIKLSGFHCGHVISEANGGSTTVDNLRPICAACNLSMGSENMNDFKKRCGFESQTTSEQPPKLICVGSMLINPANSVNPSEFMQYKRNLLLASKKLIIRPPPGQEIYYDECKRCKAYYHNAFDNSQCPGCK